MTPTDAPLHPLQRAGSWLSQTWTSRLLRGLQLDLLVLIAALAIQQAFRVLHLWLFSADLDAGTGLGEVLHAMAVGTLFDGRTAIYTVLPCLACSLAASVGLPVRIADSIRTAVATLGLLALLLLGVIQLGYLAEYGDIINHNVWLVLVYDLNSILTTIWRQFPVLPVMTGLALITLGVAWGLYRLLRRAPVEQPALAAQPLWLRLALLAVAAFILVAAGRGSISEQRAKYKDAEVSSDYFLCRAVLNAGQAMKYSLREYRRNKVKVTFELIAGDGATPRSLLAEYRPGSETAPDLDSALQITAPGHLAEPPRHIVLFLLESCDNWPLREPWLSTFDLMPELRRFGESGFLAVDSLADGDSTSGAFAALVSGLPQCGISAHYSPLSYSPFPTAPARLLKQLGYRTRIFYSGPSTWQRIHDFGKTQGFEEVYTRSRLAEAPGNEWGAHDPWLYQLVQDTLDDDQPSFTMIITTSNHPPFDVDVYAEGFPHREVPPDFPLEVREPHERMLGGTMGHHWYADRAFGRCVDQLEKQLPRLLVCATGDHFCRYYPPVGWPREVELLRGVPVLFYGPEVLDPLPLPIHPVASHRDIVRTLVELAAPAGFTFPAFGDFALDPDRGPARGFSSVVGPGWMATDDEIIDLSGGRLEPPGRSQVSAALDRERQERALAMWWLAHGTDLDLDPSAAATHPMTR